MTSGFDAIVLAGGHARRFGSDKLAAPAGGATVLDLTLAATHAAASVVCVGPRRTTTTDVRWTREDPPGDGPVPGIAAGLVEVDAPHVLLLGGDMPRAWSGVAALLAAASASGTAGSAVAPGPWVAVGSDGRLQPLLALWPTEALRRRVAAVLGSSHRSVTALYDDVEVQRVRVDDAAVRDVDTPHDLDDPGV